TVSYDSANNKFQINNANAAPVTVNWATPPATTPTTPNIEQELGFVSAGNQTIGASGNVESDYTAGAFNSSNNIFTANGGALNITVGNSATPSSGGFIINGTNDTI